jgi:hypothetical protein
MTFEAGLAWTRWVNDPNRIDGPVARHDTTLRDREQTVGVMLTGDDKPEIAKTLDCLGIGRIEAGFRL